MTFDKDWKEIAKKAWSFRLSLLAALMGGIELLLGLTDFGMPQGWFLFLSFVFSVATPLARLIAQKDLQK